MTARFSLRTVLSLVAQRSIADMNKTLYAVDWNAITASLYHIRTNMIIDRSTPSDPLLRATSSKISMFMQRFVGISKILLDKPQQQHSIPEDSERPMKFAILVWRRVLKLFLDLHPFRLRSQNIKSIQNFHSRNSDCHRRNNSGRSQDKVKFRYTIFS